MPLKIFYKLLAIFRAFNCVTAKFMNVAEEIETTIRMLLYRGLECPRNLTVGEWHVASIAYAASKWLSSKGMDKKFPSITSQRSIPNCNKTFSF